MTKPSFEKCLRRQTEKYPPWQAYALVILMVLFALSMLADALGMTKIARAQEVPPTQKEICEKIKGGSEVRGISQDKLSAYCNRYDVTL